MTTKSTRHTESESMLNARMCNRPIAIVGMSALFPDAPNLHQYWDNIVNKIDSIVDVPESRWNIEDYYDLDAETADKTYCKRGGFLPDIDFNPLEFGIPPNILEVTDVTQLLGLMVAKSAMEDAGYGETNEKVLDATGVILGVTAGMKLLGSMVSRLQYPVWEKVLRRSGLSGSDTEKIIEKMKKAYVRWEENSFPGLLGNVIAGRIANRLNLGGTNCTVDAACASSLSAMKMAISDLLEYRSDMMITGGVDADNSPLMYMCFSKTPAFTKGDNPRPFDENSGGIMIGEGMGMVVLKRLEDAERDGDSIYAVIKGIGTSSDGKFKSIYAPRSGGQANALRKAYADADIDRLSIGLLEAHGTGTAAGDVAEFDGLKEVFTENTPAKSGYPDFQHIALGSIKSQIGHTKAAAGIAGLIKTTLALHHKILPPTINIERPSEKLGIEKTPFYLNTEARPWITDGEQRRAGVSAFGFGGTNFHFVLEEFQETHSGAFRMHKTPATVFLSAATPKELDKVCSGLLAELETVGADERHRKLLESSRENSIPKKHARLGFVTDSLANTVEMLGQAVSTLESKNDKTEWNVKGISYRQQALETKGKVVALFSGQGSQYMNMGKELFLNFPSMTGPYSALDKLFTEKSTSSSKPLSDLVFPIAVFNDEEQEAQLAQLQRTEIAQPAIGGISAGLFRIMRDAGLQTDFSAGHSFGELTALWAAGVIAEEDYYKLAYARGQAMAAPDDLNFDAGSMLAVMGKVEKLEADFAEFPDVVMANLNSKKQVVLAGPTDSILKAHDALKEKKYTVVKLPVSAAFHTPLVGHAQKPFAKAIREVKFNKPQIPVYSNATSKAYPSAAKTIQKQLESHILNSVRFREEIENIHQDGGRIFIEFGPKNVLTKLVDNILADKEYTAVALNENPKKDSDLLLREALVKLCVVGLPLQKFDPYAMPAPLPPAKKSAMSVSLNGANYVSDTTKKDFEKALSDGFQVSNGTPSVSGPGSIPTTGKTLPPPVISAAPTVTNSLQTEKPAPQIETETDKQRPANISTMSKQQPPSQQTFAPAQMETLERSLSGFYQHQNETLQVHRQYLDQQSEYSRTVYQLMQQQIELASQGTQIPAAVDQQMQMFHAHQGETLRVHEQYLHQQSEQTQSALSITHQQLGNSGSAPETVQTSAPVVQISAPVAAPTPAVVKPVSAPTPVQTDQVPVVPASTVSTPDPVVQAPTVSQGTTSTVSAERITQVTLAVVSEKTGYPQEMLELGMDMESDLGIDSIKRVEILGSVQDQVPQLPEVPGDELAEMRTLGEIVEHLQSKLGTPSSSAPQTAPAQSEVQDTPVSSSVSGNSAADVTSVMLAIVSEKTGYPQEMLELSMDMESDLGIDSIKRVEILGSVQDQIPQLPEVPGDELAEMRTLGQIVEHLKSKMGDDVSTVESPVAEVVATPKSSGTIGVDPTPVFMSIISEKTGYPSEMLELSMDMEADLGIDSIKRVEIMWALQEQYQNLPQIGANDIAELRTVGQIIEHVKTILPAVGEVAIPELDLVENSASTATSADSSGNGNGSAAADLGSAPGEIAPALLSIIGEKTGYPVEMLELSMDMEADLGIDSIKRVEIMWSLQEQLPHLPQVSGSEIGELRTLKEIVDHLGSLAPAETSGVAIIPAPVSDSTEPVKKNS
ncbi:MAG: beta-ketoacyl synthase N-terminal-like domain-containing protein [SAR324 cluster bacterium]|jgi:polyketide-type polyunsaturated fatty acid synthase PfaA|nr:beta-ketoacyl synthase N-terminal-like domain-containing protein [SAR324 cluster bacterium]